MTSEAQRKAVKKYKEKVNRITIDFSPAESELWEHIQNQPKKQTYIKSLIRADMGTKIFLIYKDDNDDYCSFIGRFVGTEEEVEKYCEEYNKKCRYYWEKIDWLCVSEMDDVKQISTEGT